MKITHCFGGGKKAEAKPAGRPEFLLTDGAGGWLLLPAAGPPSSRYQGWFARLEDGKIFKIAEDIRRREAPRPEEIKNFFWGAEIKSGPAGQTFFLPRFRRSLAFESPETTELELALDIREPYDSRESVKKYEISAGKSGAAVKCSFPDAPPVYLAVASDGRAAPRPEAERWALRDYAGDKKRNSPPFSKRVFRPLELRCRKAVLSASRSEKAARREARETLASLEKIKTAEKNRAEAAFRRFSGGAPKRAEPALLCALNSLASLAVRLPDGPGLYAGLPWFFQFWARDEALSLKSLSEIDPALAKKILARMARSVGKDGRPPAALGGPEGKAADGTGWIFKRAADFASSGLFKAEEASEIKKLVRSAVSGLAKKHTENGLAVCGGRETWMDSVERPGARIEIQALRLSVYDSAYRLTGEKRYREMEKRLKALVRKKFWNGKTLADGDGDFTVRPNIFVAAYAYPRLLTREQWSKCFANALPKLWLGWGGLATIDKGSALFRSEHTGEKPESYHNGDSWFFLNNMAALVLCRTDKKKFKKEAGAILEASAAEILSRGAVGHHSELSSAASLRAEGCRAQAWSAALFAEAVREFYS